MLNRVAEFIGIFIVNYEYKVNMMQGATMEKIVNGILYFHNKNPLQSVVMVKEGASKIIVKRQSYEDMLKNEVL